METIEELMSDANEMFARITLAEETDWQGEAANIPDDAYPEEDGGEIVSASYAEPDFPETVDRLADSVLEDLTGVTREWLTPVRPDFERLAALAMSKHVTDADFLAALEKAQRDMPELFDKLNSEALETAFENAIGSAMLAGSVKRYEP